jgi:hypothetical protein
MTFQPLERRVLAVGTAIVLHAVLLGIAAGVQAIVARAGRVWVVPQEPLLVTAVALLMAHCSLGALWWARAKWPSYAKTLAAALATALIWVLLLGVLNTADLSESAAVAWAASLTIQAVLAGLGAAALGLLRAPRAEAAQTRFTIMFLLLWTAVVAVLLGAGRALSEAFGWKMADVLAWEYLYQLQTIGVANAVLAVGLLAALQFSSSWSVRLLLALAALLLVAVATPIAMMLIFRNAGASVADLVWLPLAEGLFVLATLVPLEAVKMSNVENQMSNQ